MLTERNNISSNKVGATNLIFKSTDKKFIVRPQTGKHKLQNDWITEHKPHNYTENVT